MHNLGAIRRPVRKKLPFKFISRYGTTVPGTLLDRVVSIGESPVKCVFRKCGNKEFILKDGIDGHVDSIRLQLHSRNYVDRNSEEHFMLRLLTTSM